MKAPGIPDTLELPEPVKGARAVKQFSLRDGTILNGEYKLVFVDNRGAVYGLVEITCPTTETLREEIERLREALTQARDHLEWTGYGDGYERECAVQSGIPETIRKALEGE